MLWVDRPRFRVTDPVSGILTYFTRSTETGLGEIDPVCCGKGEGDQVRACVMDCATGEQAYSVAILLLEHASTLDNAPKMQIFATDIDEGSLASARKGRYPESITEHVA
jgi:two-component system, chemotaxis family, CheB/CheR fusion protein